MGTFKLEIFTGLLLINIKKKIIKEIINFLSFFVRIRLETSNKKIVQSSVVKNVLNQPKMIILKKQTKI